MNFGRLGVCRIWPFFVLANIDQLWCHRRHFLQFVWASCGQLLPPFGICSQAESCWESEEAFESRRAFCQWVTLWYASSVPVIADNPAKLHIAAPWSGCRWVRGCVQDGLSGVSVHRSLSSDAPCLWFRTLALPPSSKGGHAHDSCVVCICLSPMHGTRMCGLASTGRQFRTPLISRTWTHVSYCVGGHLFLGSLGRVAPSVADVKGILRLP